MGAHPRDDKTPLNGTAYRVQTVVTLDGLRVRMRDYARTALGKAVNREDRNAAIVKAFKEHGGTQVCAAVVVHMYAGPASREHTPSHGVQQQQQQRIATPHYT